MPERPTLSETLIINGLAGTGSTTVARMLAERFGWTHHYGGGIFRQMAAEADRTLEQYMADLADHPDRERGVDERLIGYALAGETVIESRVVAWLMPADTNALAVWLTCDDDVRVDRVMQRDDHEDAKRRVEAREEIDANRYLALYGIDLADLSVYDVVIDTTQIPAIEVAEQVATAIAAHTE